MVERLNRTVERFNLTVERFNLTAERLNLTVERLNRTVERFNLTVEWLNRTVKRLCRTKKRLWRVKKPLWRVKKWLRQWIGAGQDECKSIHFKHLRAISLERSQFVMAKRDFYPNTDGAKLSFLQNLVEQLATVGTTVGETDVAPLTNALNDLQSAISAKVAAKAAAQSATAAWSALDRSTEDLVRAHVRRIKASAGYTEAIGEQLGIEGAESAQPQAGDQPDLKAISVLPGEVIVTFQKRGYSGVEISSKRAAETEFTFLARDTQEPYTDTRPNLAQGPETRQYRAQFLTKDAATGPFSDVLMVTVPGT
jgi:hypothetical protein